MNKKKMGLVSLSAALSVSLLVPGVSATATTNGAHEEERVRIQIASVEKVVTKQELIKKINELFPGKFDFLTSNDFHMNTGHRFPEDDEDIVRYNLDFGKEISAGKHVHGNFEFIGEDLKLNHFSYEPPNAADALFPPKVSRTGAQKMAETFLKEISLDENEYKLSDDKRYYHRPNQTLTEPIRYDFAFEKMKNAVPISNQNINVTVLGNGEITNFSRNYQNASDFTYEENKNVKSSVEVLKQIKDNFSVDLQYMVEFDYQTKESKVQLTYLPLPSVNGVHAKTGNWMVQNNFVETLPASREIKMLLDQPLQPKTNNFSLEDAKALAEKLLSVGDIEGIKLNIEGIDERKNHYGKDVISINYMYMMQNSGSGTNIELDTKTGEIISYHDLKQQLLREYGKIKEPTTEISYQEALIRAIQYAKEYAPSYLHNLAYPTVEASIGRDGYTITFPRVQNGIYVANQGLHVGVYKDGTLNSFRMDFNDVEKWPSKEDAMQEEAAIKKFIDSLSVELRYMNNYWETDSKEYKLVYMLKYGETEHRFIDALTGEWKTPYYAEDKDVEEAVVTDHWAADELNFMISAGIVKAENPEKFNANASVTKGEALEVMMKSLTRFYEDYYGHPAETPTPSFENIPVDHPLYQVVERAVQFGVLDKESKAFDVDALLTRQELATWYIRALNLEKAAKHSELYNMSFADASLVEQEKRGYVALANALGILTITSDKKFNPNQEVSFGQLAVSCFRLAKLAHDDNRINRY